MLSAPSSRYQIVLEKSKEIIFDSFGSTVFWKNVYGDSQDIENSGKAALIKNGKEVDYSIIQNF